MAIIKPKQTTNSIYPSEKIGSIDIYDKSTENITLDYFSIINKIFNNSLEEYCSYLKEKKESAFNRSSTPLSQIISSSIKEPYKEKSFFEKVSFFLLTTKEVLKISKIDTHIDTINKLTNTTLPKLNKQKENIKYHYIGNDLEKLLDKTQQMLKKNILELYTKHPEYKQLKDEFDRLHDERTNKTEQMNQLVLELNNYRQFILDEYNPIVLKLIDASKEFETDFKMQYMDLVKKLYQKIDYKFKSSSLKEIIKSDILYKWDELKNNVEILEKDNQALDIEISKIIDNHFFINFKNKDFKYFEPVKTKLDSMIKENEEKVESQRKKNSSKQKLENIINSVDEKEKILEEKKINKEIQLQKSKLEKLKKELKALEDRFQNLCEQRTEYLNDIEEFNSEYNLHLGELIKDILNLKKEILYKQTINQKKEKEKYQEDINIFEDTKKTIDELKSTISELEDALKSIDKNDENYEEISLAYDELQEELKKLENELELQKEELEKTKEFIDDETIEQEFEEINSQYEEFENEYQHIKESFKDTINLNENEKKELKSLYKKAARLCHPDIVPDDLKERAHNLMQKLNDAYSKKDITKVKEILHSLQNGTSFEVSSDTIDDIELLKEKIKEFKQSIKDIEKEIEEINEDVTFQTILEINDWDEYFKNLKNELQNEKEILENEARKIIKEKSELKRKKVEDDDIPEWMQILWDWADANNIDNAFQKENRFGKYWTNGLPRNKEQLLQIKELNLTNIKELPDEITYLDNLTSLIIECTELKILPNLNKFKKLSYLSINCNSIYRFPTINNINNIIYINITSNNIYIDKFTYHYIKFFERIDCTENFIDSKNINFIKGNSQEMRFQSLSLKDIEVLPIEIKYFTHLKELDLWNNNLSELPVEIARLKNLEILKLGFNQLSKLPEEIIELKNLKILQLYGNPLILSEKQLKWIEKIKSYGCKVSNYNDADHSKQLYFFNEKINTTSSEDSFYLKHIQSIENIKFEKIRKYCENLTKENSADTMQINLAEYGRMYKALMYSTLEVLMENLNEETITLYDWGCSQGIASMLVLDYIKEKQLDIKVSEIVFIDDNIKALSRAISQVEALAQESIKFTAIKSDDNKVLDIIKSSRNNIILNLFANDKIPENFLDIDYEIYDKSYFLCVSNENKEFVDEVYKHIHNGMDTQNMSILDGKIGRYSKHERIFKAEFCEIPF